jgi:hypothetical protein
LSLILFPTVDTEDLFLDPVVKNGLHRSDLENFAFENSIGLACEAVIEKIGKQLSCEICQNSLKSESSGLHSTASQLILLKKGNDAKLPGKDVVDLCLMTSNVLDAFLKNINFKFNKFSFEVIQKEVYRLIDVDSTFTYLKYHDESHKNDLIHRVIEVFLAYKLNLFIKNNNKNVKNHASKKFIHLSKYC